MSLEDVNRPAPPHRGQVLHDYTLHRANGSTFSLFEYQGKLNLLLFIFPDFNDAHLELCRALASRAAALREYETQPILLTRHRPSHDLDSIFEVALDEEGSLAAGLLGNVGSAIYVTDKFREVITRWLLAANDTLPSADELLGWAQFAMMQCPECHPPEWPADDVA